jgi:hypothetical protein
MRYASFAVIPMLAFMLVYGVARASGLDRVELATSP